MSKYDGAMPDSFFRVLDSKEEQEFRQWTRDNWRRDCVPDDFSVCHPVVRDEWRKLDMTFDAANGVNAFPNQYKTKG